MEEFYLFRVSNREKTRLNLVDNYFMLIVELNRIGNGNGKEGNLVSHHFSQMARASQTTVTGRHESMSKHMTKITRRSLTITKIQHQIPVTKYTRDKNLF